MPRGPSQPRFTDPAFPKAVAEALRRYKGGQNPTNNKLRNKELADILKVSEPRISRLLQVEGLQHGEKAQILSALSLAMALKAGVSVVYDHVELNARQCDGLGSATQTGGTGSEPRQISFVFETGFTCESTAEGLTVKRKEPASSTAFNVQVKVS
jgi:hypothetical protein